jgi:hypothetical protein
MQNDNHIKTGESTRTADKWQTRVIYGFMISDGYDGILTDEEQDEIHKNPRDNYDFFDKFLKTLKMTKDTINRIHYYITDFEFKSTTENEGDENALIIGMECATLKVNYSGVTQAPTNFEWLQEVINIFVKDNPRFEHCEVQLLVYTNMRK